MPPELTTTQLEAVQRLVVAPVQEMIRAQLAAGVERMAVDRARTDEILREFSHRLNAAESRIGRLEKIRAALIAGCAALTSFVYWFGRKHSN